MRRKVLYAIPTMKCNLDCPHCFIKDTPETYNRDRFIEELNNFDGEIILFGGEPTSNEERMFDIIESNKNGASVFNSISTNLTKLNDRLLDFYKSLHHVATSWNPSRFSSPELYEKWTHNCKELSKHGINYTIMITLTDDLFELDLNEFLEKVHSWETDRIVCVKFEHFVGDVDEEYFERADEWLCKLYQQWNTSIPLEIADRIDHWSYDCRHIYTLYPDGTLTNQCPHHKVGVVPTECYSCDRISECRPCKLQHFCSYPKRFAELVHSSRKE